MLLNANCRRFCVLTVGRSGSTSLMNYLARFADIGLPCKDVACEDNELLHPSRIRLYSEFYARRCNQIIETPNALIECFFREQATAYSGFKSMPNRHADFASFITRPDIRFITLVRDDIASTVASFIVAMNTGSWRRSGEPQASRWFFDESRDGKSVRSNLAYVLQSNAMLRRIPQAIALSYEELCSPSFRHAALDEFFSRPISIERPRPPTHGRSYVGNWDEFEAFVHRATSSIQLR